MAEAVLAAPLIGRQRQLGWAHGWVAELTAGVGQAILLEGEPGIGKSALVRAAADEAEAVGCQLYWAACDELSQAFPLLPLLDALEARAAPGKRGQPTIAELLRADTMGTPVDVVSTAAERLLALIDEVCANAPAMLVVDDLQWADAATVRTFGRLVRTVSQLPLLLIGAMRPVPRRDDLLALRRTIEPTGLLSLHNLAGSEVAEFVARAVNGTPGPSLLQLAEGASGNPLYLTELVDALVRGNALVAEGGTVEVIGDKAPESLSAAIADRLEFLPAPVRELLRAAALLGTDFSVAELAVVSNRRVSELLPTLDEAMLAGVIREQGAELAFRHPLIREALYEAMPVAVRAAWHRDAGRALVEAGAPADQVARQLLPALEAADATALPPVDDWVVRWLVDSVQHLVSQAPNAAIPLLRWVIADRPAGLAPHDVLACRLADALYRIGDPSGATQVATGALGYVKRADLVVDLHWTLAQCCAMDGRSEEAIAALDRALTSPNVGPQQRARLMVLSARTHNRLGQLDIARQLAEAALASATTVNDRWATGWALGVLTMVHGMRGDSTRALPLYDRALAVTEGDPALTDLRLVLQINQASAFGDLDRYDDAIAAAERARQLADEASNVVRLTQAQSVLGELLFDVGRWDDALAEVDPAAGVAKGPVVECADRGVAAAIRLHRGDSDARAGLAEAEQFAALLGDQVIGSLTLARALDREQADEPADALGVLMAGLSDSDDEIEETIDLLADAVRLAIAVNDEGAARAIVARAEATAQVSDVPHRRAVAQHCRGLLDHDPVPLLQAAEHYGQAGRPLPRAQALEAAGVVLAEAGDVPGARTHFTSAFALYTALNANWDLARTQARFRTYGIRRGPSVRHRRSRRGWTSLTPTELRIVRLVAEGMSNPQIAGQLFLSRRTVQTHVSHILAKLDLHSRIDIAREASLRDLDPAT